MSEKAERCYLCGIAVRAYALQKGEKPAFDFRTCDHVPPAGLFPQPRPTNLTTVPCCFKCNNEHSGFDERLRIIAAMSFDRNASGQRILDEKVINGTLAKMRQMRFVEMLLHSMKPVAGHPNLILSQIDAKEFKEGAIRITKGLLAKLHPEFNYHESYFHVEQISLRPCAEQSNLIGMLKAGTHFQIGDGVFQCWRYLDLERGGGCWMLIFYECFGFFVAHANNSETFRLWQNP